LTSAIETAMARAPGVDFEWVRRHFVHHDRASYFVIPNLYSVDQTNSAEELRALAMNHLAGVFDDLKLVRTLSTSELKHFGREERRDSYSDLSPFREHMAGGDADQPINQLRRFLGSSAQEPATPAPRQTRNHGLLSKAQRALDIAGWSAAAQRDVEIFRLVTTGGLTPLLTVLNEGALAKANEGLISTQRVPSSATDDRTPPNRETTTGIPMIEHRRAS
jgi:hypothetical protein